jgi:putative nucleotidyltransferase with HDIG domain
MREHASSIRTVAPERIQEELVKLLTRAVRPSIGFRLMRETGLLREILPELDQAVGVDQPGGYHAFDVFEHSLATLDASPADLIQRLAALLHDVGKPATRNLTLDGATFYGHDRLAARMTREALQRLRFSRDITEVVVLLVRFHMFTMGPGVTDKGLRRLVRRVGEDHIYELLNTRRADIVAQGRDLSTQEVDEFEARIQIELAEKPPLGLKALTVNGNDVMRRFGLAPGPLVGRILDHLLETVLDRPEMNEKEALLDEARRFLEERKP